MWVSSRAYELIREQIGRALGRRCVAERFIEERGFRTSLPFLLTQYLVATLNGNAEVALSLGRAIESCEDVDEALGGNIRRHVFETVKVERTP